MFFIKLILVSSRIGVYVTFPVYSVIDSLWVCVEACLGKWCMRKLPFVTCITWVFIILSATFASFKKTVVAGNNCFTDFFGQIKVQDFSF